MPQPLLAEAYRFLFIAALNQSLFTACGARGGGGADGRGPPGDRGAFGSRGVLGPISGLLRIESAMRLRARSISVTVTMTFCCGRTTAAGSFTNVSASWLTW